MRRLAGIFLLLLAGAMAGRVVTMTLFGHGVDARALVPVALASAAIQLGLLALFRLDRAPRGEATR